MSLSLLGIGYNGNSWLDWSWVTDHAGEIQQRLDDHIRLTLMSVLVGLIVSLPIAIYAQRHRRTMTPILVACGVIYTIPSIAALSILFTYFGFAAATAVIPLASYTLVILVRNIVTGLDAVDADTLEAADGMGFARLERLRKIEIPLALPSIAAGLRIALVTTIGLVPVTAIFGQSNLGLLITDGLQRAFRTPLVVGLVLSVLLAVVADLLVQGATWFAMPWVRSKS
jgi:osmoprotectant transport system permease protein